MSISREDCLRLDVEVAQAAGIGHGLLTKARRVNRYPTDIGEMTLRTCVGCATTCWLVEFEAAPPKYVGEAEEGLLENCAITD